MNSTKSLLGPWPCGPLLAAAVLVLAGVISLWAQCSFSHTAADEDWQRAAEAAVQRAQPTDGIRIHPSWTETPMPHLGPVGNLLHRHHEPLLEDFLGIERVLVLTETARRDKALQRLPFEPTVDGAEHFDSVSLLAVAIPEHLQLRNDLTDALADATVSYRLPDGDEQRCRKRPGDANTWRCDGRRTGAEVGPVLMEVEHEPRRCIKAFPPSDGRVLSVELSVENPLDILRIRAGLDNRAARLERGDDVVYRLYVDGEKIADERVDAHTSTWTAHDVATNDGNAVDLRIEVESVVPAPHHRRFCFNGWPMTGEQARY